MIAKKGENVRNLIKERRTNTVLQILDNISTSKDIWYRQDAINQISRAIAEASRFPYVPKIQVNRLEPPRSIEFINLYENMSKFSDFQYEFHEEIIDPLNNMEESILNFKDAIEDEIDDLESIISTMETSGQVKKGLKSIHGDTIKVFSFNNEAGITGDLQVDASGSLLRLRSLTDEIITTDWQNAPDSIVEYIKVNNLQPLSYSLSENKIIDGYYFGRFYTGNIHIPDLELTTPLPNDIRNIFKLSGGLRRFGGETNPSRSLYDTKGLSIEYVSTRDETRKSLSIGNSFKFDYGIVSYVHIRTLSESNQTEIEMDNVSINGGKDTEYALGKNVNIRNLTIPMRDSRMLNRVKHVYINMTEPLNTLSFNLIQNIPQPITYNVLQYKAKSDQRVVKEYNYVESAVILGNPPELTKYWKMLTGNTSIVNPYLDNDNYIPEIVERQGKRYVVSLDALELHRCTYESEGESYLDTIEGDGRILSIELYTDHTIPEGTNLEYLIDTGQGLIPIEDYNASGNRLSFDKDIKGSYVNLNIQSFSPVIRMKTTNSNITPLIRGMIFRVKTEV